MDTSFKDKICNLMEILSIINEELISRKNCSITDEKGGKNYLFNNQHDKNPCPRSALVANQRFKNKCVFCNGSHQPDKYKAITDPSARKEFLKSAKRCLLCLKERHFD